MKMKRTPGDRPSKRVLMIGLFMLGAVALMFTTNRSTVLNTSITSPYVDQGAETVEKIDSERGKNVESVALEVDEEQLGSLSPEEAQLRYPKGDIHITHFFSTFTVPTTSPAYYEMKIVQESWKNAAIRALQSSGIKVEFIDTTMPGDTGTSPAFAKNVELNWWLLDVKKGRVPTVGEPFNIVQKIGRGQLMMFTNADIGVMPDFYERAWAWANTDFRTPEAQLEAMKKTARFVAACYFNLSLFGKTMPDEHYDLCREDARVFYIHAGGFDEVWRRDDFRLQIGLLAAQLQRQVKPEDAPIKRITDMLRALAPVKASGAIASANAVGWRDYLTNFEPKQVPVELLRSIPAPLFAGTVTRIDIEYAPNSTNWDGEVQMYNRMLEILPTKGLRHPGNDCFLFHRDNLPAEIKLLGHPAGVRPFGMWLVASWWMSGNPYRRITANRKQPWTFHVGIGLWGLDNIPWKERANESPPYTLFLAANYDRLSKGGLRKMFEGPEVCTNSTVAWRSQRFCNYNSNEFCAGIIRFACYYKLNHNLRDVIWYFENCLAMHERRHGVMKNPVCRFCNFIFGLKASSKRFHCEEGQMEYCEGLGEGVC